MQSSTARIPTLDGWRGIAILLVLADHGQLIAQGSYVAPVGLHGVAIFFVLSGFLITSRLREEQCATGSINLTNFYLRRLFRLIPCAWCFLLFICIFSWESPRSDVLAPHEILGSLFFFRNYVDTGYGPHVTGQFWSLSIEEQFYMVWPMLFILTGKHSRWIAMLGAVMIALYRAANWNHLTHLIDLHLAATFGTQFRADALLTGCALALFLPAIKSYLRAWMSAPLLAGLGLCLVNYHALIPLRESLIIAALLAVTSQVPSRLSTLLDSKALSSLGLVSYSLYIWQQPFLLPPHRLGSLLWAVALLPCVTLISYYLIEKPHIEKAKQVCANPPVWLPRLVIRRGLERPSTDHVGV